MPQRDALRELDAEILGPLEDAGLTDTATFRQVDSLNEVEGITVLVDHGVAYQGADGFVLNDQIVITAYLAQIEQPKPGAEFVVGDVTYRVDRVQVKDESRVVCLVTYDDAC